MWVDELISLLLFYRRDGFVDLRQACDLSAWWDTYGSMIEPGEIMEAVARFPALERTVVAALRVAQRIVGLPGERLLAHARVERRVRLTTALANPDSSGSAKQRFGDIWLIDCLLTPRRGRRECIKRQLGEQPGGPRAGQ
jgi:hypothetical protein